MMQYAYQQKNKFKGDMFWGFQRDIDGAMAFGGCRFIKRCNYQLSVGVRCGRYFGEDARLGWSMWEDAFPSFGTTIGKHKK